MPGDGRRSSPDSGSTACSEGRHPAAELLSHHVRRPPTRECAVATQRLSLRIDADLKKDLEREAWGEERTLLRRGLAAEFDPCKESAHRACLRESRPPTLANAPAGKATHAVLAVPDGGVAEY